MDTRLSGIHWREAQFPGPAVDRLLYASVCRVDGPVFEEMRRIRDDALARNAADNVCAALLFQSGWFMEWLEGPTAGIDAAMGRLAGDPRHRDLRIVHHSQGRRRLTQPWSMVFRQGNEDPAQFKRRVVSLEDKGRRQQLDPAAVWRGISMPLNLAGPAASLESHQFQRVMICSARGTGSFDLVRWLGQKYQSTVTNQRFAGASPETSDVATDYVDLDRGAGAVVRRVIAMARNGLQIGLTQALLPDASHLILLLSGEGTRDAGLMEALISACARLEHRPFLVGLGHEGCDHAALRDMARAGGLIYLDCDVSGRRDSQQLWSAAEPALDISRG